ncbi:MAG TPA: phage minor head protein [Ramlibacter sp.]|nr:phage minor head protein [Ramlibacter sp.]
MAQTPQQAFEAALRERLRERAGTILGTDQAVIAELKAAREQILQVLASQPADWQQWQMTRLLDQLNAVLEGATGRATVAVDGGLRSAWQQGEDFIDKPLAAGGLNVELQLPLLDVRVLTHLRTFTALRLKDVGTEAAGKIGRQLSQVTLGTRSPFEAIKAIQAQLGNETTRRATTIVRTEVGRAFAVASYQRLQQAAKLVPGLQKQWRRSGKIHSRWNHDAVDGQVVDVDQPFTLPSENGPVKMLHPHDPAAPVEEVINCGCLALPYRSTWKVATPGAKPFSELELQQDGRKAALDQAAKRAGMRRLSQE